MTKTKTITTEIVRIDNVKVDNVKGIVRVDSMKDTEQAPRRPKHRCAEYDRIVFYRRLALFLQYMGVVFMTLAVLMLSYAIGTNTWHLLPSVLVALVMSAIMFSCQYAAEKEARNPRRKVGLEKDRIMRRVRAMQRARERRGIMYARQFGTV